VIVEITTAQPTQKNGTIENGHRLGILSGPFPPAIE
jgi:hypothetical protein